MKATKKKIEPKWFELHLAGLKNWELRINDCDYQKGDFLILQEWEDGHFMGREITLVISYVAKDLPYLDKNIVILSTESFGKVGN